MYYTASRGDDHGFTEARIFFFWFVFSNHRVVLGRVFIRIPCTSNTSKPPNILFENTVHYISKYHDKSWAISKMKHKKKVNILCIILWSYESYDVNIFYRFTFQGALKILCVFQGTRYSLRSEKITYHAIFNNFLFILTDFSFSLFSHTLLNISVCVNNQPNMKWFTHLLPRQLTHPGAYMHPLVRIWAILAFLLYNILLNRLIWCTIIVFICTSMIMTTIVCRIRTYFHDVLIVNQRSVVVNIQLSYFRAVETVLRICHSLCVFRIVVTVLQVNVKLSSHVSSDFVRLKRCVCCITQLYINVTCCSAWTIPEKLTD